MFSRELIDSLENETDVREEIVSPLLKALGYAKGTENDILRERSLKYGRVFLGHKKPSDPEVRGRADYICEVRSYGRWTVEVKAPTVELSVDDAHQAHTYSAHPEVAGLYSLLTNGKEFRLYRFAEPETPLISWPVEKTGDHLMMVKNLIGPDAIRRAAHRSIDPHKPLGPHFGSKLRIVGGSVTYDSHLINGQPQEMLKSMSVMAVGRDVERHQDGRIVARLEVRSQFPDWDAFNRAAGIEFYEFWTSDEYVSDDEQRPTIFQGLTGGLIPAGTTIPTFGGMATELTGQRLPISLPMKAATEAIGFIRDDRFAGTFVVDYGFLTGGYRLTAEGTFDLILK